MLDYCTCIPRTFAYFRTLPDTSAFRERAKEQTGSDVTQ